MPPHPRPDAFARLRRGALPVALVVVFLLPGAPGGPSIGPAGSPPEPGAPVGAGGHRTTSPDAVPRSLAVGGPGEVPQAAIDPFATYTSEPAPMGIADFGVDPSGRSYSYTTDTFVGTANITALSLDNRALSAARHNGSLQLNVILVFASGGVPYAFWVQNTVSLATASNNVGFVNNIWNVSQGSDGWMPTTTVRPGSNGSVIGSGFKSFYYAAASNQSGNNVDLTYPASISLRLRSNVSDGGVPRVYFDFNDGYGWQTYDTVDFFAGGVTSAVFRVTGTTYLPGGGYYDAELVFGGPYNAETTNFTAADLNLSLEYDNGHNLAAVPAAYDFGGNTAESSNHVEETLGASSPTGALVSHLAYNASGALAALYFRNDSAIFNGTTTIPNGTYSINGEVLGEFRGFGLNLTLAPGEYAIALRSPSGAETVAQVLLSAGEYLPFNFDPPPSYNVTFVSVGLPGGTPWNVEFQNTRQWSPSGTLTEAAPNGSYAFSLGPVAGWQPDPTHGVITVAGGPTNVTIDWSEVTYPLQVTAVGLPPGLGWSIDIQGTVQVSSGGPLSIPLPNGTYAWTAGYVPGYRAVVATGTVGVVGPGASLVLWFVEVYYAVELVATGLPPGAPWGAILDGTNFSVTSTTLNLTLPNGTYGYTIYAGVPYAVAEPSGTLRVDGGPAAIFLRFGPLPATISGTVSPAGAVVRLDGGPVTVAAGSYSLQLLPGTYVLNVSATGFSSRTWTVVATPGEQLTLNLTLPPLVGPPPASELVGAAGLGSPFVLLGILLAAGVGLGVAGALVQRRRRPRG